MNIKAEKWYEYGIMIGEISKYIDMISMMFLNRYGFTSKCYKYCNELSMVFFYNIQKDLTNVIINSYPFAKLKGYDNIVTINVFKEINRHNMSEYDNLCKRVRPLPRTLLPEHYDQCVDFIQEMRWRLYNINEVLFDNDSASINKFLTALKKVERFIRIEAVIDETNYRVKNDFIPTIAINAINPKVVITKNSFEGVVRNYLI